MYVYSYHYHAVTMHLNNVVALIFLCIYMH